MEATIPSTEKAHRPLITIKGLILTLMAGGSVCMATSFWFFWKIAMVGLACFGISLILTIIFDVLGRRNYGTLKAILVLAMIGFFWASLVVPMCACG